MPSRKLMPLTWYNPDLFAGDGAAPLQALYLSFRCLTNSTKTACTSGNQVSPELLPILQPLKAACTWPCRPVVVLAERDKEEMDKELRGSLKGYALEWHTRTGAPHNLSDLARVAAGQAKTVILLDPDDSEVWPHADAGAALCHALGALFCY